ncbi:protein-(glutamine-N5) methyltransferase, release factor-specific [Vulcanibacillus modesticaldus]|uniref:Release factor glutamine methyltransferase n=1 Tax=Vulcanibacillus modesticaldus TaxID=337097 RepID=A0A1D2YVU0_9BACI|nr:peptide chain release factor N(5)-glutamine methyltransferase [Vulcanibacillus modesticaldus]OEF99848.1 protein-(glutamine-N5) methyltransferase, release factor-specific [Vulcanibacillus modesticaldus]
MRMTIKEAYSWASSFLEKNKIDNPSLEAEVMIRTLHNWDRSQFFLNLEIILSINKYQQLKEWLYRRIQHEPLQYIIGTQDFYGRTFRVTPNVLIPRPETELLIETVIKEANKLWGEKPITAVDIGTGSGAIAITLALEKEEWEVHTVDISKEAIKVASDNAAKLHANITFHHGDLLLPLIKKQIQVDLIISNPPYIPSQDILDLMPEVRDFEPTLALDGGIDGLNFYRQILKQSSSILKLPGIIAFEIGVNQSDMIKNLFYQSGAKEVKVLPDFQNIPRIAIGWY